MNYFTIVAIFVVLLYAMYCSFVMAFKDHDSIVLRVVSIVVFGMATYLFVQRDTYLPFLGSTALPSSLLKDTLSPTGSNVETDVSLSMPDGTRVIYWGAAPKTGANTNNIVANPILAYGNYKNAGIAVVNKGKARFRFFCPVKYQVPWGKTLDRHIHYRVILDSVMIGPVKTVYVNC